MPIVPKTKAEIEVSVWDPLSNQNLGFEVNRMLAKIHSELVKMPLLWKQVRRGLLKTHHCKVVKIRLNTLLARDFLRGISQMC